MKMLLAVSVPSLVFISLVFCCVLGIEFLWPDSPGLVTWLNLVVSVLVAVGMGYLAGAIRRSSLFVPAGGAAALSSVYWWFVFFFNGVHYGVLFSIFATLAIVVSYGGGAVVYFIKNYRYSI